MRYATWNIRHGTDRASKGTLGAQGRLLAELDADVVMLQEVDRGVERSGFENQLEILSRLCGLEHRVFGSNLRIGSGDYGTALLSRWPVLEWANEPVPQWHAPGVYITGEDGRPHLPEARGVLHALVAAPAGPLRCITTHASMHDLERREGARIITQIVSSTAGCWVAGGDMNAGPDEHGDLFQLLGTDVLTAGGVDVPTFPGTSVSIDRMWACSPGRASVVETELSDHHLVLFEV
jgi:endonuclease/exonuclease/phosphatase family metal-dependent hydrolase